MQIQHHPTTAKSPDTAINLVLLHGWAMHSGIWEPVLNQLRAHCHIWCVDLPGHGLANGLPREHEWPADNPLALSEKIASQVPDNSIWLGWSMGGLFALQAACEKYCRALVLVASNPSFIQREHWPNAMPETVFQSFADDLEASFERALRRFLALEVHGSEQAKQQLQTLIAIAFAHGTPSLEALRGGLRLLQQADFSQQLAELELPTLIIGGRRDKLVPWAGLQQTAQTMPHATLQRIPGAGHAPFIGDPSMFSDTVVSFCNGL